jgi:hypothetical protein
MDTIVGAKSHVQQVAPFPSSSKCRYFRKELPLAMYKESPRDGGYKILRIHSCRIRTLPLAPVPQSLLASSVLACPELEETEIGELCARSGLVEN